ncbi:metal-dependent hydrolase [Roseibium denhamense]|uniref:Inner membrane protein n=1 Tax=Roseibium denhamense TaxID=76305 RepID=A0ABY1NTJ2_9HYPH|nr:metal-dependent hydrolase [Roseibium denhamense]MTI05338.1 metal-dependent hydrolase [Roseibium denhamense]SMP17225.1 inner membrane protein [Roseibium denhamense]
MDSITQFALGAVVSTACLGPKIGPRKAALIGGMLGTVPDLDVFIPFDDPIDSFVYHRGWTHSVFVHALAAPIFGEILVHMFKGLRDHRWLAYVTVYLCFVTHAFIDAMTVYGTRIFWPFYPDPVGVGSVFIIDPLYSLPLLAVVVLALFKGSWSRWFGRMTAAVLITTTGYMAVSAGLQHLIVSGARADLSDKGIPTDRVFAIAAPFNILLWKVIAIEDDRYHNLYISILDPDEPPRLYTHSRHPELVACLEDTPAYQKLDWFSRGFNRAELVEGRVVMSDLRMGLTPAYAFRFAIGEETDAGIVPIPPERNLSLRRVDDEDFGWLGDRLLGRPSIRQAETGAQSYEAPGATVTASSGSVCAHG